MNLKKIILIVILFTVSILIVYLWLPSTGYLYGNYGKLIINEVMSKNTNSFIDNNGDYSDWIELYNDNNFDINLKGYHLSDDEYETNIWSFPEITIKSKSYLIIFASGKNRCIDNECHTNFKLSNSGEVITLTDDTGTIISKISYKGSKNDTSYGYNGRKYVYYEKGTPGKKNIGKYYNNPIGSNDSKISVYINEYITNNKRFVTDEDGHYSNYVEIYNYGDTDINLEGYYLSDNVNNLDKYMFGSIIIKSHDYLVVYCSSKNKSDNEIHTNFKLSDNDKHLIISNYKGDIIDIVELVDLKDNISYGRNKDGWCYYMYPTFGYENNTKCFKELR